MQTTIDEARPYMPTKAASEEWGTPPEIFDQLNAEFGFTVDAAASAANAKCDRYWTKEDDGLAQDWRGEVVWCNPPYSVKALNAFARKAATAAQDGATTVLLVPAKTDQGWFHFLWNCDSDWFQADFRWVRGRVRFIGAKHGATFASVVIVVRPVEVTP